MSVSKNSITGDSIQTKTITEQYRANYDLIFGKKSKTVVEYDNLIIGEKNEIKNENSCDSTSTDIISK
jgi:hypothetical protein